MKMLIDVLLLLIGLKLNMGAAYYIILGIAAAINCALCGGKIGKAIKD